MVGAEEGRDPVRVHAHDEVEPDQAEHQGEREAIYTGPAGHAASNAVGIGGVARGGAGHQPPQARNGRARLHPEPEGLPEEHEADDVKHQQPGAVAGKNERDVQPHLLAVQLFVHPREHMGVSEIQDEKQHEGEREEARKRARQPVQRAAPAGPGDAGDGREEHRALGHRRPEEKIDEIRLPGTAGLLARGADEKGRQAGRGEDGGGRKHRTPGRGRAHDRLRSGARVHSKTLTSPPFFSKKSVSSPRRLLSQAASTPKCSPEQRGSYTSSPS